MYIIYIFFIFFINTQFFKFSSIIKPIKNIWPKTWKITWKVSDFRVGVGRVFGTPRHQLD